MSRATDLYELTAPRGVLPRLTVQGAHICARTDEGEVPVRIKGLNRAGFQHKPSLRAAGFPQDPFDEFQQWRTAWRAAMVRLPLAQDRYLEQPGYRSELGLLVDAA